MSDCRIVKRLDHFTIPFGENKPRGVKKWGGICPKCNKFIVGRPIYGPYYSTTNTRKTARDALHFHMRVEHR